MSGPYNQQSLGQGVGRAGGVSGGALVGGVSGGPLVGGVSGGPLVGQTAGQTGAHFGQSSTQFTSHSVAQYTTGQSGGQLTGQSVGQTSAARGDRARRQRNDSTSSTSSSDHVYKLSGATEGASGGHQQYSAEASYGAGVSGGTSFTAGSDYSATAVSGQRRQGRFQQQVIRLPDQAQGQVRQVRRRLPTPEPDTLERVYVQRIGNEVIEEITEVPTTPPPRVQERTVVEPAGPPQVVRRVIRVPPRSGGGYQFQQGGSFATNQGYSGGNLLGAGSYGNVQQAYGGYQQYGGGYGAVSSGYGSVGGGYGSFGGGYGSVGGGYGSLGGGYQQQSYGYGGYGAQTAAPLGAIPGANCFYV